MIDRHSESLLKFADMLHDGEFGELTTGQKKQLVGLVSDWQAENVR
jgi:hypothetical protein